MKIKQNFQYTNGGTVLKSPNRKFLLFGPKTECPLSSGLRQKSVVLLYSLVMNSLNLKIYFYYYNYEISGVRDEQD